LQDLIDALKAGRAEIGLAFDGDGDRLGFVTKNGKIIYPDRQLMLFAADVLKRNPAPKLYFDVKSTRNLFAWIRKTRWQADSMENRAFLQLRPNLKETGALLAGEMSGHIFFQGSLVRL
jgi:phosphomannomutase/phosphoglucomutase